MCSWLESNSQRVIKELDNELTEIRTFQLTSNAIELRARSAYLCIAYGISSAGMQTEQVKFSHSSSVAHLCNAFGISKVLVEAIVTKIT